MASARFTRTCGRPHWSLNPMSCMVARVVIHRFQCFSFTVCMLALWCFSIYQCKKYDWFPWTCFCCVFLVASRPCFALRYFQWFWSVDVAEALELCERENSHLRWRRCGILGRLLSETCFCWWWFHLLYIFSTEKKTFCQTDVMFVFPQPNRWSTD